MNNLKKRFASFAVGDWIILAFSVVMTIVGLYFSIAMSVKLSQGVTLFGNSDAYTGDIETQGPTQADKLILSLFWILSLILLGFSVFYAFFKSMAKKPVVHKEIVAGRTVIIQEKKDSHDGE
jgi:hypothetical protein